MGGFGHDDQGLRGRCSNGLRNNVLHGPLRDLLLRELAPGALRNRVVLSRVHLRAVLLELLVHNGAVFVLVLDEGAHKPARSPMMLVKESSILVLVPLGNLLHGSLLCIIIEVSSLAVSEVELVGHSGLLLGHLFEDLGSHTGNARAILVDQLSPLLVTHDDGLMELLLGLLPAGRVLSLLRSGGSRRLRLMSIPAVGVVADVGVILLRVPPGVLILLLVLVVVSVLVVGLPVQVLVLGGRNIGSVLMNLLVAEGRVLLLLAQVMVVLLLLRVLVALGGPPGRGALLVLVPSLRLLLLEPGGLFLVLSAALSKSLLAGFLCAILLHVILLTHVTVGGPPVARVVLRRLFLLLLRCLILGSGGEAPSLLTLLADEVIVVLSLPVPVGLLEVTELVDRDSAQ